MPLTEIAILLVLGLVAGALGGLLGIGGSIVMIPVLTLILDKNQHLSQAAAMIVNLLVAFPATLQHHRARAIRWDVLVRMLPFGLVFILLGVGASNRVDGEMLTWGFGLFLLYVVVMNVAKMLDGNGEPHTDHQRTGLVRSGFVGATTGFTAGLLGIGGGIITVPLLQRVVRLPLRQCIATSAAVMCATSVFGALMKNLTLSRLTDDSGVSLGLDAGQSLPIAIYLAPTAILGGLLGAKLTHILPVQLVRLALILLLCAAAAKMLGVF